MRVLVTAGPTREAIDPVRYISNRSSGRMGFALARAAVEAGHEVVLVAGPVSLPTPRGVSRRIDIESAEEMARATLAELPKADALFMAAAVADFTLQRVARKKLKKADGIPELKLVRTRDVLDIAGRRKRPGQVICGFDAETGEARTEALRKLKSKKLDWIVANDVSRPGCGFATKTNAVAIHGRDGTEKNVGLRSKLACARIILATVLGTGK
ncbi:MAG: phosphopantothenoylcysteine decarboxylase [Kiritimatiellae bacterium]|nr:phosphopantothenoylcysteine decarboxylase [Kiritimatiellia bacterium]